MKEGSLTERTILIDILGKYCNLFPSNGVDISTKSEFNKTLILYQKTSNNSWQAYF